MGGDTPKQEVTTTNTNQNNRSNTTGDTTSSGSAYGSTTGQQFGATSGQMNVQIPDWLKQFVGQSTGVAGSSLGTAANLASGYQLPPEALQALQQTAGGQYLYGGPQQQAFIDAAVRGAAPGIFSQFGAAGGGGGGLQKAALDQSAVDAYASLYGDERNRQLQAATALPGITQMPFNMQSQLAQLAAGLPGQFAPFLGQNTSGTSFGFNSGTSMGTTQDTSHTNQQTVGSSTGQQTDTKPLYETPWWQTALGAVGAGAGLLGSLNPATGIGMAAKSAPMIGGLVGAFR
jgi:hypothetical protein